MTTEAHAEAMSAPIRRLDVGGAQGRGNPAASRYHVETATVAKVKCSTPRYPQSESTRGLFTSRWFYIGGAASAGIVAILGWGAWKLVNL